MEIECLINWTKEHGCHLVITETPESGDAWIHQVKVELKSGAGDPEGPTNMLYRMVFDPLDWNNMMDDLKRGHNIHISSFLLGKNLKWSWFSS